MDKEDGSILNLDATQYDATVDRLKKSKRKQPQHLSGTYLAPVQRKIYIYISVGPK